MRPPPFAPARPGPLLAAAWARLLSLPVAPPQQCSVLGGWGGDRRGAGKAVANSESPGSGLEQKPPFSWEKVSPADNMLSDDSFSFRGTGLFNISCLSPALFQAAHTGHGGLPGKLLERLEPPGTSLVLVPPAGPGRWVLHVSMLPSAGRRRRWHRLGNTARAPTLQVKGRRAPGHAWGRQPRDVS